MVLGAILLFEYPVVDPAGSGVNPFGFLFLGPILGFIGFILLIAGLAASGPQSPTVIYESSGGRGSAEDTDPDRWVRQRLEYHMGRGTAPTVDPSESQPQAARMQGREDSIAKAGTRTGGGSVEAGGFCPFCGAPAQQGHRFCRSCGKELNS